MKDSKAFKISTQLTPQGDQPSAIESICRAFGSDTKHYTLMGVTGSGKTFTMANVIQRAQLPTLIMAPNKTLAAQLFSELKEFFPENSVEFFISYYDYYQPEAYVPSTDTYIAKDSAINDDIDKMRHAATQALFERKDVIIVASISCIYGLGSPDSYAKLVINVNEGLEVSRDTFLRSLVDIQYTRNDAALVRGSFRVRGDTVDLLPANQKSECIRISFFGSEIEAIEIVDAITGSTIKRVSELSIYPNSHYVTDRTDTKQIVHEILVDLGIRLRELQAQGKLVEYQRLEQRTMHDIEMFEHLGWCVGIENYSRYLSGAKPGEPPPTLLDYFPEDYLIILDESHLTVPQIRGMFRGDRARKQVLVDFGFRLPSALDNRPLSFDEFMTRTNKILYVSATPSAYEFQASGGRYAEQIIRPTGLIDPKIEVRSASNQVDDLYGEILLTIKNQGRILVTTLTKRMAEELARYFQDLNLRVKYLHSDIDSLDRVELLRDLRKGLIDVLIGINLLREGLDLPEVKLVAVMDADKEGFLRSRASLIQIVGRAARNSESKVIFYGDRITDSMAACIGETERRRTIQIAHNEANQITPTTITKKMGMGLREIYGLAPESSASLDPIEDFEKLKKQYKIGSIADIEKLIKKKNSQMLKAAGSLAFEDAANLRDEIATLKGLLFQFAESESPDHE